MPSRSIATGPVADWTPANQLMDEDGAGTGGGHARSGISWDQHRDCGRLCTIDTANGAGIGSGWATRSSRCRSGPAAWSSRPAGAGQSARGLSVVSKDLNNRLFVWLDSTIGTRLRLRGLQWHALAQWSGRACAVAGVARQSSLAGASFRDYGLPNRRRILMQ
jgi:hypothetical protein